MAGYFVRYGEIEVDGLLTDSVGHSVNVHCRISFPVSGHESVSIELSIPHASMPVMALEEPFSFEGTTVGPPTPIKICLTDIHCRRYTQALGNPTQYGRSAIDLLHIGSLEITVSQDHDLIADERLVTVHVTNPRLTQDMRRLGAGALADSHPIFSTPLAELGSATFHRYWNSCFDHDKDVFSGVAGTYATIALNSPVTDVNAVVAYVDRLLLVLSLFSRQTVLRRSVHFCADGLSHYSRRYPLDDERPPYIPFEPSDYPVSLRNLEDVLSRAVAVAIPLPEEDWESIRILISALTPALPLSTGERFMALMFGLESIRVPTPIPDEETKRNDAELIDALESLKANRTPNFVQRIEGFQSQISKGPSGNFKGRMRELFKDSPVFVADLWPLAGSKRNLGLIDLRDRLAHMGARSVNPQSLTIALWHLGMHAERYCFEKLGIPLEQTKISPKNLGLEQWYSKPIWHKARSDAKS